MKNSNPPAAPEQTVNDTEPPPAAPVDVRGTIGFPIASLDLAEILLTQLSGEPAGEHTDQAVHYLKCAVAVLRSRP